MQNLQGLLVHHSLSVRRCHSLVPPGYRVAQVRLIFSLQFDEKTHPFHSKTCAYVEWFSELRVPEKDIKMYRVQRVIHDGKRAGDIIPIEAISRFVQLVPYFGVNATKEPAMTAANSMDVCRYFYLNSFADKEIFLSVI